MNLQHCLFTDLGLLGVPQAEALMISASDEVSEGTVPDLLLFLAHPPTVAVGIRDRGTGTPKDLLVPPEQLEAEGIALVRSVRGGGITYHWPGQIVCYPVLRLRAAERNIAGYMTRLEEIGIVTLKKLGIHAERRRDAAAYIGLWVDGKKIASMGIRVSRWVTSFGFAMNLDGDYAASQYVRPCGIEGLRLTTIEDILGQAPSRVQVMDLIRESFQSVFQRTLEPMRQELLPALNDFLAD